ncbi:fructosamine-3-kinase [Geomicrobium halophilum]|uniref:Fructosamine-3-kinase n=1 Tax=Geomicrobium halophilum TaxID=549000 RepID=A0A841PP33_9BACL|nr:fructosamine-3-kinase [Geomicrobium halophilum]
MALSLKEAGVDENAEVIPISGGDINQSYHVRSENTEYFLKWHDDPPPLFFQKEAKQLTILENVSGVHVPEVIRSGDRYLLLSWIEGSQTSTTEENLGASIAALHQEEGTYFGFAEDNFIGTMPQYNAEKKSWVEFYGAYRLLPQIEEACQRGKMPKKRRKQAFHLLDHLDQWLPEPNYPALLHGDLWAGNWMVGQEGVPYFIDPAISYGDPAYDRAMMALFGGYSSRTMDRYYMEVERPSEEASIIPIYQLYFLFAHLNMFGEMYGPSVDRILNKYSS